MELKRGQRARVQSEMVQFIALPFPFPSKLKIWSFNVVVVQWRQRNVQKKRDARAELLFCSLNLLFFWRSRCRRRRGFVRSLITPAPSPSAPLTTLSSCEHNNDTNTDITNSTIIIIPIASITTSTVIQTMTTTAITIIYIIITISTTNIIGRITTTLPTSSPSITTSTVIQTMTTTAITIIYIIITISTTNIIGRITTTLPTSSPSITTSTVIQTMTTTAITII